MRSIHYQFRSLNSIVISSPVTQARLRTAGLRGPARSLFSDRLLVVQQLALSLSGFASGELTKVVRLIGKVFALLVGYVSMAGRYTAFADALDRLPFVLEVPLSNRHEALTNPFSAKVSGLDVCRRIRR